MKTKEQLAEEWIKSHDYATQDKLCSWFADRHFIAGYDKGREAAQAEIKELREALEIIIKHELYEGINQGKNSEIIAQETLAKYPAKGEA